MRLEAELLLATAGAGGGLVIVLVRGAGATAVGLESSEPACVFYCSVQLSDPVNAQATTNFLLSLCS